MEIASIQKLINKVLAEEISKEDQLNLYYALMRLKLLEIDHKSAVNAFISFKEKLVEYSQLKDSQKSVSEIDNIIKEKVKILFGEDFNENNNDHRLYSTAFWECYYLLNPFSNRD